MFKSIRKFYKKHHQRQLASYVVLSGVMVLVFVIRPDWLRRLVDLLSFVINFVFAGIASFFLLTLPALPNEIHQYWLDKAYVPQINQSPKYYFRITGYVDKKLQKKVKPRFYASFQAMNPKCDRKKPFFADVSSTPRYKDIVFNPKWTGNKFFIAIPIDYYVEDNCRWKMDYISESFIASQKTGRLPTSTVVSFAKSTRNDLRENAFSTYLCSNQAECKTLKYSSFFSKSDYDGPLLRDKNYGFKDTYLARE